MLQALPCPVPHYGLCNEEGQLYDWAPLCGLLVSSRTDFSSKRVTADHHGRHLRHKPPQLDGRRLVLLHLAPMAPGRFEDQHSGPASIETDQVFIRDIHLSASPSDIHSLDP